MPPKFKKISKAEMDKKQYLTMVQKQNKRRTNAVKKFEKQKAEKLETEGKGKGGIYEFFAVRSSKFLPKVVSIKDDSRKIKEGNVKIKVEKGDKSVKMTLVNKNHKFENAKDSSKDASSKRMSRKNFDKLVSEERMEFIK